MALSRKKLIVVISLFLIFGTCFLTIPWVINVAKAQDFYVTSGLTRQVLRYNGTTGAFMNVFASGGGLREPLFLVFHGAPAPAVTAVPTFTEWGMIILIVFLGTGSVLYLKRRRAAI